MSNLCDLTDIDIADVLKKFGTKQGTTYEEALFKSLPEPLPPPTPTETPSIQSVLGQMPDLSFPTAAAPKNPYKLQSRPAIKTREERLYLQIALCKKKIEFLNAQHDIVDEYMGRGVRALGPRRVEFLSTINYPDYVMGQDNIESIRTTLSQNITELVADTKFYKSIEGNGSK